VEYVVIGLSLLLVGCLAYVIYFAMKMGSSRSKRANYEEPDYDPGPNAQPSPSTADKDSNPLGDKDQAPEEEDESHEEESTDSKNPSDTGATVREAPDTGQAKEEEEPVEDHATQSAGVSDEEVVHGKTMALSSFNFDEMLNERKNQNDESADDESADDESADDESADDESADDEEDKSSSR
jgi:hypothetical protein